MSILAGNQSHFNQVRNLKRKKHINRNFTTYKVIRTKQLFSPSFFRWRMKNMCQMLMIMMMTILQRVCFVSAVRLLAGRSPRRGTQAALAETCEKHRKNFEKMRNLSFVLERTSSAMLAFKNKDCRCCAGLAGRSPRRGQHAALADSSVFRKRLHTFVAM